MAYKYLNPFFYNKNILVNNWLQSYYIKRGILNSLYNIPWKIGIIYNYTDESYRYNNISVILGDENYKNKLIPSYEGHNVVDIFINNYCGRPNRYTDNRTIEHGYLNEYFDSQELFDQFVRAEEILREIALIKQAEVTNGT